MEGNIRRRDSHIMRKSVCLLLLIVIGISCANADNSDNNGHGNLKDITFARPKHLRYPSYKSFHQNGTSANERLGLKMDRISSSEEELASQESRTTKVEQQTKSSRKANNNNTPTTSISGNSTLNNKEAASNLKRSLLPHGDILSPEHKSPRFGSPLGIQKTPPDLQFGLAFTVPFVSLSTDKLLNTFSGKSSHGGQHDVSSILKLNLGGLIAAVVVGIAAFLFIPGLLSPGKFGGLGGGNGWGGSLLDSILPHGIPGIIDHFVGGGGGSGNYPSSDGAGWNGGQEDHIGNRPFGYQDYYEYNGVHNHNRKDTSDGLLREKSGRREGRSDTNGTSPSSKLFGNLMSTVTKYAKKYISTAEECLQLQICKKGVANSQTKDTSNKKTDEEESVDLIGLVESLSHNELVKGSPLSEGIKKAHEYGLKQRECRKFEKPECSALM